MRLLITVLAAATACSTAVAAAGPLPRNPWVGGKVQQRRHEAKPRRRQATEAAIRLRGGAGDSKPSSARIKGVCIGIDLGTTYR
eukprot:9472-Heterococcus_DN1.PRE.5